MTMQECYKAIGGNYEAVLGRLHSEALIKRFTLKFLEDQSYLQLKPVSYTHLKSFSEVKAVNDLSFRVKKGELFAFLGVNGAGDVYKRQLAYRVIKGKNIYSSKSKARKITLKTATVKGCLLYTSKNAQ